MIRAIDDPLAIGRVERAAVVAQFMRELFDVPSVSIHRINIEVAAAQGSERDLFSVN